ncbi:MAG: PD40 domain-containing protein [Lachnospiraceae bacterium]|nr:PD40 domain-containing protein [Lachnospiraceae bacterium]
MRFGVNLFGSTVEFTKDKEGFLKKISELGYRYVEPCISFIDAPGLREHAWSLTELKENYDLLKKYGLKINSVHVFSADIKNDAAALADLAGEYDIKQFICPLMVKEQTKEAYEGLIPVLSSVSDTLKEAGAELLLHNSENESKARIEGVSAYEWVLHKLKGKAYAQPDVGWLYAGGTDPEEFLWRNEDQIRSLHYKDFKKTGDTFTEVAIGTGDIDMMAAFQFARYAEVIQISDQDSAATTMLADLESTAGKFRMLSQGRDNSKSTLCIMDADTGKITELKTFDGVIEAPNWYQQNDNYLYYNSNGLIYRYDISAGTSTALDSGKCTNCNNDHVLSADGKSIAVSHSDSGWQSQVYIFPIEGGEPRLITENFPSFLHGWSPDGKELAYCAFRGDMSKGSFSVDIYAIPAEGGKEYPLTKDAGFNDGPEYSPDGKKILFISTRTGLMQNWVMDRDGSNQTQLTFSERNNWFGHYSPDGKRIVYLSYSKEGLDPNEHLPNMKVQLRMMDADGKNDKIILEFFGGQGSINVNSWAPDSKRFAFVKYELIHK